MLECSRYVHDTNAGSNMFMRQCLCPEPFTLIQQILLAIAGHISLDGDKNQALPVTTSNTQLQQSQKPQKQPDTFILKIHSITMHS